MTPAEEMTAMFAAGINWDVVDELTDEQLAALTEDDEEES